MEMSSSFTSYLALLRLVDDASRELGLSHLTASDKQVLLAMTTFAGTGNIAKSFTYAKYSDVVGAEHAVSRAQFFKSIDRLLSAKVVKKQGAGRSATFLVKA
jgi:hypothetical protein